SGRIRRVSQHECVSVHSEPDGAAIALIEKFERLKQSRESADTGQRVYADARCYAKHVRDQSEFPRRICADVAAFDSARSSRGTSDDGAVPGNEGQPAAAGSPSGYVSRG